MSEPGTSGRAVYLLGGRRVLVSDLVAAQLLAPGAELIFDRRRSGDSHRATVEKDGKLRLEDGRCFNSPSRAAGAAVGTSVDGWNAWRVAESGELLDVLRQRLLDDAAQETFDREARPSNEDASVRHNFLASARERAKAGDAVELTVADLIAKWGARARGQGISEHISADLDNHGLVTRPDFMKVGLDSSVTIELQAVAPGTEPDDAPTEVEERSIEVGLTLGNIPSANSALAGISPQATIEEAITIMLLNDYSQLAVIVGSRSFKGAVTWQSIARERHANDGATLADAIIPAEVLRYDTELIDVLAILEERDFVFVKDGAEIVTGIVTTADVVHAYGQLATPFFLIGELDQLLRRTVSDSVPIDVAARLCYRDGPRRIESYDDLSMGDYERVLQHPDTWATLHWPLDRRTFIERLKRLRDARNDVMHFNPDPLPENLVGQLRNMIRLLKRYG